ncbi:MAG: universal stress protein [Cupriavidus sp.]|nr:universal stress protein [Cupriavidus sp.]
MYQRILVAIDGSHSADLALGQAITVAKATGAEVRAVFVADDSDLFFEVSHIDNDTLMKNIAAYGSDTLKAASTRLTEAGIRCSIRLFDKPISPGKISATIVAEADTWNADLIVLGTHGRRGIRRIVMGSVSEGVVSKTLRPILLVRSEAKD